MLITMILAKTLDLSANGTYVQCVTIISVGLSLISLGLMEGSNYFFANADCKQERQEYIDTILFLVYLSGFILAGLLILFREPISRYFSNSVLSGLMWIIALRPMLSSLINVLNVLYIATGRAKTVVLRNAAISFVHLVIVIVTALTTKNVAMILCLYLAAEFVTDGLMLWSFGRGEFSVRFRLPKADVVRRILRYCLPMAAYIAMNSLLRDTDKLIIGRFESTEMQAIYSNCAKILPLDVVSAAFYTILVPKITRRIAEGQLDEARKLFSDYLKVGLLSTATFAIAISLCADQAICLLYSKEYLLGKNVFLLYNIVELLKFANVTIVISAVGRTKTLMIISAAALVVNLGIGLVLYHWMGFVGPAVGTVVVTAITIGILFFISARILHTSPVQLLDFRFLLGYLVKGFVATVLCLFVKRVLLRFGVHQYLVLFAVSGLFCVCMLLANIRQIKAALVQIDRNSEEHV
jgi:O-antigen/teichoic acid export membrane protein